MKKLLQFTLLVAMVFTFTNSISAQKKMSNGLIKFKITEVDSDNQMASMMQGTTIETYFKDEWVKTNFSMMGGMIRNQTIVNSNKKTGVMLYDMMGKKIAVDLDMEKAEEKTPDYTISYDKKDVKTIAGYKCYRADVKIKDGDNMVMYITDKITPVGSQLNQQFKDLKGFPLQYQMDNGGLKMTLKASEVSTTVPSSNEFEVPDGYEKMTMEEFQKMAGSMGGM